MTPPPISQDVAIGTGAVSLPLWLQYVTTAAQEVVVIGGALLVLYRVYLIVRKIWSRRKNRTV
jgi:hypothetical protein